MSDSTLRLKPEVEKAIHSIGPRMEHFDSVQVEPIPDKPNRVREALDLAKSFLSQEDQFVLENVAKMAQIGPDESALYWELFGGPAPLWVQDQERFNKWAAEYPEEYEEYVEFKRKQMEPWLRMAAKASGSETYSWQESWPGSWRESGPENKDA